MGLQENQERNLPPASLIGPLGEWVCSATPYTEVDPAALLVTTLVSVGALVGRRPHLWAGDARQSASLFAVVVAMTPKANRGLSWIITRRLIEIVDPSFARHQIATGLSDDKALLETLRSANHYSKRLSAPQFEDPYDAPKVLVHDPGFVRTLGNAGRSKSEISRLLRHSWDGVPLEFRQGRFRIERHHIGIVAHGTFDQLVQELSMKDASAAFLNRFIIVVARRQPLVVDEGYVPFEIVERSGATLRSNLARSRSFTVMERTTEAEERWREYYRELASYDPGGLLGILLARSTRQVLRMSLIYACAEASERIELRHIEAAVALWEYCRWSTEILASRTPSVVSELEKELYAAIAASGTKGLSLSEQHNYFGRNVSAARLRSARNELEIAGKITSTMERRNDSGRKVTVSRVSTEH